MGNSGGRPIQPQQQLRVIVVPASFHHPGRRRRREGLWLVSRNRKRIGGGSPGFGERGLSNGGELKSRAWLFVKMHQIKFQDPEESQPSIGVAFEFVVPLICAGEPPVNDSHDAGPTSKCFNGPLAGNSPRPFLRLGDETFGWIP